MKEYILDVLIGIGVTFTLCLLNEGLLQFKKCANGWMEEKQRRAEQDQNEMGIRFFETAQKLVNQTVYNAVAAMEQTKAKDIRAAVKNGLKERGELEILAKDVLYSVKEQLTPDVVSILGEYVNDLDKYLQDQIESSLLQIKNQSLYISMDTVGNPDMGLECE